MLRFFAVLAAMAPLPTAAATLNFCWVGSQGYTMTGRMQIPDAKMKRHLLTEADVTRFKISGYRDGRLLGTWDNSRVAEGDTWHLRFDPATMTFLTGGSFDGPHSQGWNADGNVQNCGSPGFGFNSGNYAQDICVNGTYVHTSSIPPDTPLKATTDPVTPDCAVTIPTS
ncbi:hypothetical protein SAMN05444339_10136 [Loktanella atrilutea]|uniref:Uncharacterized protein n=1 Tax=Loktanella atrilutea TaxID=366533 RepID=A0A1M4SI82_LOKAT|nr:hypothetical protein [Loktanella atrilutea]SHE31943.1 hypothetical protein SAMN05444339_10136 [Loktanella atrilutea]